MLDSAEALFSEGGADAMTVEAIIERSGTSAGAFYARFGDRDGLLQALHDRFLGKLHELVGGIVMEGLAQPSLAAAVSVMVHGSLQVAHQHTQSLAFFVLFKASDPRLKMQGIAANNGFAEAFRQVALHHRKEIRHPKPAQAVDVAFRMLHAMLVQAVMFRARDLTGRPMADKTLAQQVSRALTAYLTEADA